MQYPHDTIVPVDQLFSQNLISFWWTFEFLLLLRKAYFMFPNMANWNSKKWKWSYETLFIQDWGKKWLSELCLGLFCWFLEPLLPVLGPLFPFLDPTPLHFWTPSPFISRYVYLYKFRASIDFTLSWILRFDKSISISLWHFSAVKTNDLFEWDIVCFYIRFEATCEMDSVF